MGWGWRLLVRFASGVWVSWWVFLLLELGFAGGVCRWGLGQLVVGYGFVSGGGVYLWDWVCMWGLGLLVGGCFLLRLGYVG